MEQGERISKTNWPKVDVANLKTADLGLIKADAYTFCGNMLAGMWPEGSEGQELAKQMAALQSELKRRGEPLILPR